MYAAILDVSAKGNLIGDKLKALGYLAFGVVAVIALLAIPIIVFLGITWVAENLLLPLTVVGWIAFAVIDRGRHVGGRVLGRDGQAAGVVCVGRFVCQRVGEGI